MSDHGWDRFKRAFGAKPSDDLIANRNNKIGLALAQVDLAIRQLTDAGLDASVPANGRRAVQQARDNALRLTNSTDKYAALDKVKTDARKLADDARDLAIDELDELFEREQQQTAAFQAALNTANGITHPLAQVSAVAARNQADLGRTQAQQLATRKARADAMDPVINTFQTTIEPLQKIDADARGLATTVQSLETRVARLPTGQIGTLARGRIGKLRTNYDALGLITDVGTFGTELAKVVKEARVAGQALTNFEKSYAEAPATIAELRTAIDALVQRGEELAAAGAGSVKAALDTVKQDLANAERITDPVDLRAALSFLDLQPLRTAIYDVGTSDGGLAAALSGAAKVVGKLPEGEQKTQLTRQYQDLKSRADEARGLVGEEAQEAFAALKAEASRLTETAAKLRGEDGFRDAITARFGITIKEKPGAIYSLEKTYQMLDLVPDSHSIQDSLKRIRFSAKDSDAGDYLPSKKRITIEKIKSDDTMDYVVDGKTVKMNEFNAMMLHEIGHAVDDKFKIMDGLMDKAGFGDWHEESRDKTLAALTQEALTAMGNPPEPLAGLVRAALDQALDGTKPGKPQGSNARQWKALQKYTGIAMAIRCKADPWFNAKPGDITVGRRIYLQAYENSWYSYRPEERQALELRDYQWRSPAEWFAEIYAVSWMNKKKTPANIADDVGKYLPA